MKSSRNGSLVLEIIAAMFVLCALGFTIWSIWSIGILKSHPDGTPTVAEAPHGHEAVAKATFGKEALDEATKAVVANMVPLSAELTDELDAIPGFQYFEYGQFAFSGEGSGVWLVSKILPEGLLTPRAKWWMNLAEYTRLVAFFHALVMRTSEQHDIGKLTVTATQWREEGTGYVAAVIFEVVKE